jgi:hypothetical protein
MTTMSKKKNIYEQKARQKAVAELGSTKAEELPTKGNWKKSLTFTGKDIIVGGIGGALGGVLVGRGAFLAGIGMTGLGYYFGSSMATAAGIGMMASGGYKTVSSLNGVEKDGMEGIKERFKNFQTALKHQLFLDKLLPKKKTAESNEGATDGVDKVQYFRHPSETVEGLDYTEANRIEEQIRESARQFETRHANEVAGTEGVEGVDGVDGLEERLL